MSDLERAVARDTEGCGDEGDDPQEEEDRLRKSEWFKCSIAFRQWLRETEGVTADGINEVFAYAKFKLTDICSMHNIIVRYF